MEFEFTPEGRDSLVKSFKNYVERLCSSSGRLPEDWQDTTDKATEVLLHLRSSSTSDGTCETEAKSTTEDLAVKLWNHIVSIKTKGSMPDTANAKLRHVCFLAMIYSTREDKGDGQVNRQIIMGMKTARAWIDCEEYEQADNVLNQTHECVMKLKTSLIERANMETTNSSKMDSVSLEKVDRQRLDVDRNLFKILTYKAEVAIAQSKNEIALNLMLTAKEMLTRFPKEITYMSMLCYNFGVDVYKRKQYEESVTWLKESYELGKEQPGCDSQNQARTLRFLANVYLEWNSDLYYDKAMNAVTLANTEYLHPAGLYLKLRILLLSSDKSSSSALNGVLNELSQHKEASVELCQNVINLMCKHNRYEPELVAKLVQKFDNSKEFGRLALCHLGALIDTKHQESSKQFAEKLIIGHNNGQVLDLNIKKRLHEMLWEQAAVNFESEQWEEALQWYNYSLSLMSPGERQETNMAKLQRNRAACLINLKKYPQAKEILSEAVRCHESASANYYLLYKLSILQEDQQTAIESLKKMVSCVKSDQSSESTETGLICLAAQLALKQDNVEIAGLAMESFINSSDDDGQVLVAIRCLLRLLLSQLEKEAETAKYNEVVDKIHQMILLAYNRLLVIQDKCDSDIKRVIQDEAIWFMKISWNLGLKCKDDSRRTKQFFTLCYKLLSLCGDEANTLNRQKTCMMMAAFACLQLARETSTDNDRREMYEECLHHISEIKVQEEKCGKLWKAGDATGTKDSADVLLLLCEFESRVKLGDGQTDHVLEQILALPNPDPKTFEIIAGVSVEPPANNKNICVRALKVAIRSHLQDQHPDFQRCSKVIHNLIQNSIGGVTSDAHVKEEVMNYYKETIDIIEKRAKDVYPEMEILWLMTKAWNCGIQFYRGGDCDDAERWCAIGLHLLSHLTTLKSSYEEKMTTIYSEILESIDKSKPSLEE